MTAPASENKPLFTPTEMWGIGIGLSSLFGIPILCFLAWVLEAEGTWVVAVLALGTPIVLGALFGSLLRGLPAVVFAGLVAAIALAQVGALAGEGKYGLLILIFAVGLFPLYLLAAWPLHRLRARSRAIEPKRAVSSTGAGLAVGMFFGALAAIVIWTATTGVGFSSLFLPLEVASLMGGAATGGIVGYLVQRVRSSPRRAA